MNVAITGIGLTSGLGDGAQAHREKILAGEHALRPLAGFFGADSPYAPVPAAWIRDREIMLSRKWAPASMLSLHVARQAVADAGLAEEQLRDAAVIVGSSRGNAAGWVSDWPARRPFKLMAASNSMHGELASVVSIELGIRGPWQVISSGCAASLDAMGMAWMMLRQGLVQRAIVIGVELPLIAEVLAAYANTGVLATGTVNDPYAEQTSGLFPAEAGAALVLESDPALASRGLAPQSLTRVSGYWCNSDADSPIGMPDDGAGLRACLAMAISGLKDEPAIAAVCPHASGTLLHARAELAALQAALPADRSVSLHPLKPYTGHTVGANGVLDCAVLTRFLRDRKLPPNLPGITCPGEPFTLEPAALAAGGSTVLKIAVGMGGHNSIVSLRSPSVS
jgi:3-oxoacyl-[acyl-carrier-protein] synthase II